MLIEDIYFKIYILALLTFSPPALFQKINQLPWYEKTLRLWANDLGFKKDDKVLEIGCATGELTKYLSSGSVTMFGLDKSPAMIGKALQRNSQNSRYSIGNALELPYKSNSFDHLIAASVINLVPDQGAMIKEICRVTKTGGNVSLLFPDDMVTDYSVKEIAKSLRGFSRSALITWRRNAPKLSGDNMVKQFKKSGLRDANKKSYLNGMVSVVTGRV